ncbi:MAG: DUF2330 domain-containing protein [Cyanobacteria bacterium SBLK]|nr:DUF2330 domain-containing protein [Cyanobacteria bacterium SBLK]
MKQSRIWGGKILLSVLIVATGFSQSAIAFCGFFVSKNEAKLSNSASRVIIARQGDRSIFTMANNYQGDVTDFARIVPIPTIPTREQVSIGDNEVIQKLDDFTAPRLVRYVDDVNRMLSREIRTYGQIITVILIVGLGIILPCWIGYRKRKLHWVLLALFTIGGSIALLLPSLLGQANKAKQSLSQNSTSNVTVEESFTVGEYDVAILSATESDSLVAWLQQNEYNVSNQARSLLQDYIDRDMKFFVVRVNLEAFSREGHGFLRPIVIDYQSPEILLPIRLGTLNADADQDLLVFFLSPQYYAKVSNYRTVTIPTDARSRYREPSGSELPAFLQNEFGEFYEAIFQKQYEVEGKNVAFLEYAGYTGKCDPCSTQAPTSDLLKQAGAFWEEGGDFPLSAITRLHVRYNAENFPEDLKFVEVEQQELQIEIASEEKYFPNWGGVTFQGRYVMREPEKGSSGLAKWRYHDRYQSQWNQNLAELTGWDLKDIQEKAKQYEETISLARKWEKQGDLARELNKYETALQYYDRAIETAPNLSSIWLSKALIVDMRLQRKEEALKILEEGIDKHGILNGKILYHRNRLQYKLEVEQKN